MFRVVLLVVLGMFLLDPVSVVEAGNFIPCGGPGQDACQACHVVIMVNGLVVWLVAILGTVAALLIAFAGFRLVTSGGNQSAKEAAKSMITNIIIGYIIILAGWLLIDTGMRALLADGSALGVWNEIQCVEQPVAEWTSWSTPETVLSGTTGWNTAAPGGATAACDVVGYSGASATHDCSLQVSQCLAVPGTPTRSADGASIVCTPAQYTTVSPGSMAQCGPGNTACSPSALMTTGLSAAQANVMSCIAITESSGNPNTPPYDQSHPGSNSTACGTFQIVRTTWNSAASGACSDFYSNCQNASCNMQVMATLVRRGGYRDWTCPNCNNRAASCVAAYSGQ